MTKFLRCACICVLLIAMISFTSCSVKNPAAGSSRPVTSSVESHVSDSQSPQTHSSTSSCQNSSVAESDYFVVSDKYTHPNLFNKDDSVDFTFCGHKYNIPNCRLSDFESNGFNPLDEELTGNIKPKTYRNTRLIKGNIICALALANDSGRVIDINKGDVANIWFLAGWIDDGKNYILPHNITLGSTIKQVRSEYGAPEYINIGMASDSPDYIAYDYKQGSSTVTLYFTRNTYELFNLAINAIPVECTSDLSK